MKKITYSDLFFKREEQRGLEAAERAAQQQLLRLRIRAVAQAARVTSEELDQEAKRRWAIVTEIDQLKEQARSKPVSDPQIDAIQEKLDATDRADDADFAPAVETSRDQWRSYLIYAIRYLLVRPAPAFPRISADFERARPSMVVTVQNWSAALFQGKRTACSPAGQWRVLARGWMSPAPFRPGLLQLDPPGGAIAALRHERG
jgi:hypothetical protein